MADHIKDFRAMFNVAKAFDEQRKEHALPELQDKREAEIKKLAYAEMKKDPTMTVPPKAEDLDFDLAFNNAYSDNGFSDAYLQRSAGYVAGNLEGLVKTFDESKLEGLVGNKELLKFAGDDKYLQWAQFRAQYQNTLQVVDMAEKDVLDNETKGKLLSKSAKRVADKMLEDLKDDKTISEGVKRGYAIIAQRAFMEYHNKDTLVNAAKEMAEDMKKGIAKYEKDNGISLRGYTEAVIGNMLRAGKDEARNALYIVDSAFPDEKKKK